MKYYTAVKMNPPEASASIQTHCNNTRWEKEVVRETRVCLIPWGKKIGGRVLHRVTQTAAWPLREILIRGKRRTELMCSTSIWLEKNWKAETKPAGSSCPGQCPMRSPRDTSARTALSLTKLWPFAHISPLRPEVASRDGAGSKLPPLLPYLRLETPGGLSALWWPWEFFHGCLGLCQTSISSLPLPF